MSLSDYSKELAWRFTDIFLSQKPANKSVLQLLGVWSIQIATKINESFVIDLETLAHLWGGQYSTNQIIQFEEILLNELNWDPYRVTSWEILNHFGSFISNIEMDPSLNGGKTYQELSRLSEMFQFDEFKEKAAIFLQIALLDYNLSRYGPFVLSLLAIVCVLKSKDWVAEYRILLELVYHTFNDDDFLAQMVKVSRVAGVLFQMPTLPDDFDNVQNRFEIITEDKIFEDDEHKTQTTLNQSLTSDASFTALPDLGDESSNLPLLQIDKTSAKSKSLHSSTSEKNKKKMMYKIKKRLICKRRLN